LPAHGDPRPIGLSYGRMPFPPPPTHQGTCRIWNLSLPLIFCLFPQNYFPSPSSLPLRNRPGFFPTHGGSFTGKNRNVRYLTIFFSYLFLPRCPHTSKRFLFVCARSNFPLSASVAFPVRYHFWGPSSPNGTLLRIKKIPLWWRFFFAGGASFPSEPTSIPKYNSRSCFWVLARCFSERRYSGTPARRPPRLASCNSQFLSGLQAEGLLPPSLLRDSDLSFC